MSNPPPQTTEPEEHASDANAQAQAELLEQKLKAIELNDPQSNTVSQEPRRKKLSARDLLKRLNRRRLEVTRINFTAGGTQAGKGSHGEVVVATLMLEDGNSSDSGDQIAVKKFILSDRIDQEKFLRAFANELHVLDGLNHPNIIRLVGFVEDMEHRIAWLVFPWEANGNVREFLLSGKWELPERVCLIKDVTCGLEYLHGRQPPIRHGDLKSLNILVNSNHRAVITDFGSARIQSEASGLDPTNDSADRPTESINSSSTMNDGCPEVTVSTATAQLTLTGPSWSFRWAAPEILNQDDPCLASDIWALGWIAWEVVTDNYPFPEAKTNKSITINVVMGRLPKLYDDDQLSQIGQLCYLMVRCWKPNPRERLSASECRDALQFIPSAVPRTGDRTSQIRSAALLVEMGHMHVMQCKYKESLKLFDEAIAIARSAGEHQTMARALDRSVASHRMLSNYDQAEEACNQSLEIYTRIGDSLGRAWALYRLGEVHASQRNLVKAEESFTNALTAFTNGGSSLGQANASFRLGETHRMRSDYARAEEFLSQALAIFTRIGDSLGRGNVCRELGDLHQARSNDPESEKYFNQALAIFTSIGNSLGRANTLVGLGTVYQKQCNYLGAAESFNHALAIYTAIGSSQGRVNSLVGVGEVFLRQSRYSEAKSVLHDAAEVSNQINYGWGRNRSKFLLAEAITGEKLTTEAPP